MIEKKLKRIWLLFLVGVLGGIAYIFANYWGSLLGAMDIQFNFERNIPFVPEAIVAYLLFFPFMLTPVFTVKKYGDFVVVVGAYAILIFVSVVIFMNHPTTMYRPSVTTAGFIGWIFSVIRRIDGPNNLFPSLHVSSVVFVAFVNGYFRPKTRILSWLVAILISVSTLLVKQHALVDVIGGAIFGSGAYAFVYVIINRNNEEQAE